MDRNSQPTAGHHVVGSHLKNNAQKLPGEAFFSQAIIVKSEGRKMGDGLRVTFKKTKDVTRFRPSNPPAALRRPRRRSQSQDGRKRREASRSRYYSTSSASSWSPSRDSLSDADSSSDPVSDFNSSVSFSSSSDSSRRSRSKPRRRHVSRRKRNLTPPRTRHRPRAHSPKRIREPLRGDRQASAPQVPRGRIPVPVAPAKQEKRQLSIYRERQAELQLGAHGPPALSAPDSLLGHQVLSPMVHLPSPQAPLESSLVCPSRMISHTIAQQLEEAEKKQLEVANFISRVSTTATEHSDGTAQTLSFDNFSPPPGFASVQDTTAFRPPLSGQRWSILDLLRPLNAIFAAALSITDVVMLIQNRQYVEACELCTRMMRERRLPLYDGLELEAVTLMKRSEWRLVRQMVYQKALHFIGHIMREAAFMESTAATRMHLRATVRWLKKVEPQQQIVYLDWYAWGAACTNPRPEADPQAEPWLPLLDRWAVLNNVPLASPPPSFNISYPAELYERAALGCPVACALAVMERGDTRLSLIKAFRGSKLRSSEHPSWQYMLSKDALRHNGLQFLRDTLWHAATYGVFQAALQYTASHHYAARVLQKVYQETGFLYFNCGWAAAAGTDKSDGQGDLFEALMILEKGEGQEQCLNHTQALYLLGILQLRTLRPRDDNRLNQGLKNLLDASHRAFPTAFHRLKRIKKLGEFGVPAEHFDLKPCRLFYEAVKYGAPPPVLDWDCWSGCLDHAMAAFKSLQDWEKGVQEDHRYADLRTRIRKFQEHCSQHPDAQILMHSIPQLGPVWISGCRFSDQPYVEPDPSSSWLAKRNTVGDLVKRAERAYLGERDELKTFHLLCDALIEDDKAVVLSNNQMLHILEASDEFIQSSKQQDAKVHLVVAHLLMRLKRHPRALIQLLSINMASRCSEKAVLAAIEELHGDFLAVLGCYKIAVRKWQRAKALSWNAQRELKTLWQVVKDLEYDSLESDPNFVGITWSGRSQEILRQLALMEQQDGNHLLQLSGPLARDVALLYAFVLFRRDPQVSLKDYLARAETAHHRCIPEFSTRVPVEMRILRSIGGQNGLDQITSKNWVDSARAQLRASLTERTLLSGSASVFQSIDPFLLELAASECGFRGG